MFVEIDGTHGEGGGQMLRTAIALSLLTRKPFHMTGIRGRRIPPGLKAQHRAALELVRPLSDCRFTPVSVGSTEIRFEPGPIRGGTVSLDVGTAGSIPLILQTIIPVAAFAAEATTLTLVGGTDVSRSPTLEYLRNIPMFPTLLCTKSFTITADARGFYPKGGGKVFVSAEPKWSGDWDSLKSVAREEAGPIERTERGRLKRILVHSVASAQLRSREVAERQARSACSHLTGYEVPTPQTVEYAESRGPGSSVTLTAEFEGGAMLGADSLGARGKPSEKVGREAASLLQKEIAGGSPVDLHAADNLVLWLALLGGRIRCSAVTPHTRTNIWLIERFLGPTFRVDGTCISVD